MYLCSPLSFIVSEIYYSILKETAFSCCTSLANAPDLTSPDIKFSYELSHCTTTHWAVAWPDLLHVHAALPQSVKSQVNKENKSNQLKVLIMILHGCSEPEQTSL